MLQIKRSEYVWVISSTWRRSAWSEKNRRGRLSSLELEVDPIHHSLFRYTLNSEPKALTGDKSEGIKSRGAAEAFPEDFPQLKPRAKNLMYLYCLTQENYPGLSKKTKDKLPLA